MDDHLWDEEKARKLERLEKLVTKTRAACKANTKEYEKKIKQLKDWISDLQSGMYVNCVYCGHRFKPNPEAFPSQAEVLREHMEKCPEHPLFKAKQTIERLGKEKEWLKNEIGYELRGYGKSDDWVKRQLEIIEETMQQELKEK